MERLKVAKSMTRLIMTLPENLASFSSLLLTVKKSEPTRVREGSLPHPYILDLSGKTDSLQRLCLNLFLL